VLFSAWQPYVDSWAKHNDFSGSDHGRTGPSLPTAAAGTNSTGSSSSTWRYMFWNDTTGFAFVKREYPEFYPVFVSVLHIYILMSTMSIPYRHDICIIYVCPSRHTIAFCGVPFFHLFAPIGLQSKFRTGL
jgi:hypothetical protein